MCTDADWLYLRLYPRGEDLDGLLPVVRDWLVETGLGARPWFFMRYVDMRGQHLRLRVQGDSAEVDAWMGLLPELASRVRRAPSGRVERVTNDPYLPRPGQVPGVRVSLYSPELQKYGGHVGVRLAERHFQYSSEWFMAHELWRQELKGRRRLAAQYLARVLGEVPGGLTEHAAMWGNRLGGMKSKEAVRLAVREQLAVEGSFEDMGGLVHSLEETVASWCDAGVPVPTHRLLNLVHMDLNRLGLDPAEEALAGFVARELTHRAFARS